MSISFLRQAASLRTAIRAPVARTVTARSLSSDDAPFSEGHASKKMKSKSVPGGESVSTENVKAGREHQDLDQGREQISKGEAKQKHANFQPGLGKGTEQVGTKEKAKPYEGKSGTEPAE